MSDFLTDLVIYRVKLCLANGYTLNYCLDTVSWYCMNDRDEFFAKRLIVVYWSVLQKAI